MKRTAMPTRSTPLTAKTRLKPGKAMKKAQKPEEPRPLRDNAEGKPCTLRLPGCRHDPAYTVLCHLRRFSWGSMAKKPHDLLAVFACDICHEKEEHYDPDCTDADLLRALGETIKIQIADGIISIADNV